jgi:hypothetical protein
MFQQSERQIRINLFAAPRAKNILFFPIPGFRRKASSTPLATPLRGLRLVLKSAILTRNVKRR